MTECTAIRPNLYLYVGGELESGPQRETEIHLESCAGCRDELESARRSRQTYREAASAVAEEAEGLDLWPGIRSRMYTEGILGTGAAVQEEDVAPVRSFRLLRPWTGVAAAAALLLALPFLPRPGGGDVTPAGDPPRVVETTPTGGAPSVVPVAAPAARPVVADTENRLRPVLRGDESLAEREWKRFVEEAQNGTQTHPLDPSLYDVVGTTRRLR